MRYAVASEQEYEDQDEVYHYVREGSNLTLCGLTIHYKQDKEPGGMRLCIRCKRAYAKMAKT
jgi:hypothetical protein